MQLSIQMYVLYSHFNVEGGEVCEVCRHCARLWAAVATAQRLRSSQTSSFGSFRSKQITNAEEVPYTRPEFLRFIVQYIKLRLFVQILGSKTAALLSGGSCTVF